MMKMICTKPDAQDVEIFNAWAGELVKQGKMTTSEFAHVMHAINHAVETQASDLKANLIEYVDGLEGEE